MSVCTQCCMTINLDSCVMRMTEGYYGALRLRITLDCSVDGASRRRHRLACKMTAATVTAVTIFKSKASIAGPSQGWSDSDLQNAKWGFAQLLCLIIHDVLQAARAAGATIVHMGSQDWSVQFWGLLQGRLVICSLWTLRSPAELYYVYHRLCLTISVQSVSPHPA